MTVDERIDTTIENTLSLLECDPEYPVLPVLQGRTVDQYLECYDRLRGHGVDCEMVGIGTLCRMKSGRAIAETERALRARTNAEAFHGFGIKTTAFKHGARFESADSNAWSFAFNYGEKYTLSNDKPPELRREPYGESPHAESFRSYYTVTSRLQREACSQPEPTSLFEFA